MNQFAQHARKTLVRLSLAMASLNPVGALSVHASEIDREVAIPRHLQDGGEYQISIQQLVDHGRNLFTAVWTIGEGGGRPFVKGTGAPLADRNLPLVFPRNFNRISAPDANSCAGCHNHGRVVAHLTRVCPITVELPASVA
jgi:hypothetical protein